MDLSRTMFYFQNQTDMMFNSGATLYVDNVAKIIYDSLTKKVY